MDIISSYGAAGMDITGYRPDTSVMSAPVAASARGSFFDNFSLSGTIDSAGTAFNSLANAAGKIASNPAVAGYISQAMASKNKAQPVAVPAQSYRASVLESPTTRLVLLGVAGLLGAVLVYKIVKG